MHHPTDRIAHLNVNQYLIDDIKQHLMTISLVTYVTNDIEVSVK